MSDFEPKVWVDDTETGPFLEAAELNRIEGGIKEAHLRLDAGEWTPVARATLSDVNLAAPGAALAGFDSPAVPLASGSRVLVRAQTNATQNGIYVFNGAAQPMTRAADADADAEFRPGRSVLVLDGLHYGGRLMYFSGGTLATGLTFAAPGADRLRRVTTAQALIFGGLNGNAAVGYDIRVLGTLVGQGGKRVLMRPNSDAAGWYDNVDEITYVDEANGAAQRIGTTHRGAGLGIFLGQAHYNVSSRIDVRASFHALAEGGAKERTCRSVYSSFPIIGPTGTEGFSIRTVMGNAAGGWENSTANVTDMYFHFDGGTFTGLVRVEPVVL